MTLRYVASIQFTDMAPNVHDIVMLEMLQFNASTQEHNKWVLLLYMQCNVEEVHPALKRLKVTDVDQVC